MNFAGNVFDYAIAYFSGVVVSFTPCVYPVIPITASFIAGVNPKGSKWTGFVVSVIYVLGLAVTYCALAVFAALSGGIFGQLQNNPVIFLVAANILIFFALVMLDVIPLPNVGLNLQHKIRPRNFWTILLFGAASGLVVGPCTAPALGALLLYVASKQNVVHGVSLMFVFSYGIGTSLILIGTFSGLVANIPKSGPWLVRVKQACGLILLIAGEYFLVKAGSLMI